MDPKSASDDITLRVQQVLDLSGVSSEQLAELLLQDFELWARKHAVHKSIKGGKPHVGLKPNVLQVRVVNHYRICQIMRKPCLVMILKPRQKGASTIAEAIIYHHMRRHAGLNGALMGDVQSTSDKVFEMFRLYAKSDTYKYPDNLVNSEGTLNLTDEIILVNGSKYWKETAGSTNAGRSGTVQVLHLDEVAYFPVSEKKDPTTAVLGAFYKEDYMSLGFATSTANGPSGWFHDTWWGDNDWIKVFAAWYEFDDAVTPFSHPQARAQFERSMTQDEIDEMVQFNVSLEQLSWRRRKIRTDYKGDINKFRQEYPSSAKGAFLSSSRMRFDETAVSQLKTEAEQTYTQRMEVGNFSTQDRRNAAWLPDNHGSVIRMEEPQLGCKYLISADVCTGADQQLGGTTADPDYHSVQVWRAGYMAQNGEYQRPACVALHHSREDIDILAEIIKGMSAYYGNCIVIPEVQNCGLALVKALVRLGVNVFRRGLSSARVKRETEDEKLEAFGWSTDKLTRRWIIETAVPLVRQQEVQFNFPQILEEYTTFIIDNNGNSRAAPAKHDDHVLSSLIAIYNLGVATEYKLTHIRGIDLARLGRDPRYMAPDGFVRTMAAMNMSRR